MCSRIRVTLCASLIASLTLISAFSVIPARADDGAPPPAPPANTTSTTTDNPTVLSQVPAGTSVVVVDRSRHKVALASQEAARIVASGDPVWCPTGVLPGGATCKTTYPNLYSLVAGPAPLSNGVIWIMQGADTSGSAIVIDGTPITGTWNTAAGFSLTLKGGWTGTGAGLIDPLHPSVFGVPLTIQKWNADVTLSDITVTGVVGAGTTALKVTTSKKITLTDIDTISNAGAGASLDNRSGSSDVVVTLGEFAGNAAGDGLDILSKGAITLNSISAISNGEWGVILQNSDAAGNKPVTITGSNEFKFNNGTGLYILSKGAVSLHNITSNGNTGAGASGLFVDNTFSTNTSPQNVTITGYGIFNNNIAGEGLVIFTYGAITLTGITANGNGSYGAMLRNHGLGTIDRPYAILPRPVTITGTPDADFMNNNFGLFIDSLGAITLNGVEADNNSDWGATLQNNYTNAVGGITFGGWGCDFSSNQLNYGLQVLTNGAITGGGTFGLSAWNNNTYGALLDNHGAFTPKAVSINTSLTSYGGNKSGDGLDVYSLGAITLKNLTADGNSGAGAYLFNQYPTAVGGITLTGSLGFHDNKANGLDAYSKGAITLNSVDAANNVEGAYLNNNFSGAAGGVTINGSSNFHDNSSYGLLVESLGAITLNNMNVANNQIGASLLNSYNAATGGITINGSSSFHDNRDNGLNAFSQGNILLHNVDFGNNGTAHVADQGYGAYLKNDFLSALGNVTITGYGSFHENFINGLEVESNGLVTLNNIYAANNGISNGVDPVWGYGAYVNNSGAGTPKAVTLAGNNNFDNNYSGGLNISSRGAITISNLNANNSAGGAGVILDNTPSLSSSPQNVTLTGHADFHNNWGDGLTVLSYGAITLTNVNVSDNHGGNGIFLNNYLGTIAKPVTINGFVNTNNNINGYGLSIFSLGAIKIANLNADHNDNGVLINNYYENPAPVTITGGAYTTNNTGYGMWVLSRGAITFSLVDAYIGGNGVYGWTLDNSSPGAIGGITLSTGTFNNLDFDSNGSFGLTVVSLGNIKITNLDAWNNGGYGVILSNAAPGSVGNVTLLTTNGDNNFNNNHGNGLVVTSNQAITITGLHADGNSNAGAILENTFSGSGSPQNVTLLGHSTLTNNGADGLRIQSYGAITLNGLDANNNGTNHGATNGWGAYIDNCGYNDGSKTCVSAVTPKAVTLNGTNNFFTNFQDGLWITSLGAIKVNQVGAGSNTNNGAYLANQWTGAVGGITITTSNPVNINYFTDNGAYGLLARSNGALTLTSIWANRNINGGAFLDNCNDMGSGCTVASGNVTLSGRNRFNKNGDHISHTAEGLDILTDGNITINNLIANGNDNDGAYLNNCLNYGGGCTSFGNLTITGMNDFSSNYFDGLFFSSGGTVSLTRVTSDQNTLGAGVLGVAHGPITLTCGSFNNNGSSGLYLSSPATMTLIHVIATGNGTDITTTGGGSRVIVPTCPLP
jgi:putative surface-exposed virulence protein